MDKFSGLIAFTTVVREGSFAAAARSLRKSRSQINKLVIGLEEDLGVQLLSRTTRKVTPTQTGRAFFERAAAILSDLTEAESAARDAQLTPVGDLKINAPMSFGTLCLSPVLARFAALYPEIRLELVLDDRHVDPVSSGFDLTIRLSEPVSQTDMIDHQVTPVARGLYASPEFLARHGTPKTAQDLRRTRCLHYGNLPSGNFWTLNGPEGLERISVTGVICSNNAEMLRDAALEHLGVALLPEFVLGPQLSQGKLVRIMPEYSPPLLFLNLLYPPHRHFSLRMQLLVEHLFSAFGKGLPGRPDTPFPAPDRPV